MRTNLAEQAAAFARRMESYKARVMVCAGTGCVANGSMEVFHRFEEVVADRGLSISVQLDRRESDYVLSRSAARAFVRWARWSPSTPRASFIPG